MAFRVRHLRELIKGPPIIWSYWTDDTATKVLARDYFDGAKSIIGAGDWILATTSTGGLFLHVDDIDPLEVSQPR
jgi:hypothetical protein